MRKLQRLNICVSGIHLLGEVAPVRKFQRLNRCVLGIHLLGAEQHCDAAVNEETMTGQPLQYSMPLYNALEPCRLSWAHS